MTEDQIPKQNEPLLIVFEGIDNSGKTSISQQVAGILKGDISAVSIEGTSEEFAKDFSYFIADPRNRWEWSKEPTFSTAVADKLNDPNNKIDEYEREVLFLTSRLERQPFYRAQSTILDRYLWSGLAYSQMFSPKVLDFAKRLYVSEDIFKKPDLTIFVDTPVELCHEREPEVSIERLSGIRQAYLDCKPYVSGPIETITGEGDLVTNTTAAMDIIKKYFFSDDTHPRFKFSTPFPALPKQGGFKSEK